MARRAVFIVAVLLLLSGPVAMVLTGIGSGWDRNAPDPPADPPAEAPEPLAADPGAGESGVEPPPGCDLVRGMVLDAVTCVPISGARVERGGRAAFTDGNGWWRLPVARYDFTAWRVTAPGYLPGRPENFLGMGGSYRQGLAPRVFLRRATVEIHGRVLGPDGAPVGDADVVVDGPIEREVRTDAQGRFGPWPAEGGEAGFEVFTAEGLTWYERVGIPRDARGRFDVTIRLPAAEFATGITVDDRGRPVPGVKLANGCACSGPRVTSGPDGRFRWPVAETVGWFQATKPGYFCSSENEVRAGEHALVVMDRAASLEGRVVRADGSPPPPSLWIRCQPEIEVMVAADGRFCIQAIPPREATLSISFRTKDQGFLRYLATHELELGFGEHRTGTVIELPPLVELEGRVIDARTRRPIAGATVSEVQTDAEGRYVLTVPAKEERRTGLRLLVRADGYVPMWTEHSANAVIELVPAREVEVTVVDHTGQPVPGTVICVPGAECRRDDISGITDADGRCRVRVPVGQSTTIVCYAPGRSGHGRECGAEETTFRMVLPPVEVRTVLLARDEHGDPLPDAYVDSSAGRTPADSDGRIEIRVFGDGAFLTAPGREEVSRSAWPAGGSGPHEIRLRETAPVLIRVVHFDGRPAPSAFIELPCGNCWSDADGRVELTGYPRGEEIEVTVEVEGFRPITQRVTADGTLRTIRLPGRGTLLVRYPPDLAEGEPWVECLADGLDGEELPAFWTRRPGAVQLSIEESTVSVRVRVLPGAPRCYPDLRIRPGERIVVDYDFPRHGRIHGRVLGPGGEPLEDACVAILEQEFTNWRTDAEGSFVLEFLELSVVPVGPARLVVGHKDFAPALVGPIDLGRDQELTIRLTRGGRLRGRVEGSEGQVILEILTPGAADPPEAKSDRKGRFGFDAPVRAGRHQLRITAPSGETWLREVEIEDGVDRDVTFRVP